VQNIAELKGCYIFTELLLMELLRTKWYRNYSKPH